MGQEFDRYHTSMSRPDESPTGPGGSGWGRTKRLKLHCPLRVALRRERCHVYVYVHTNRVYTACHEEKDVYVYVQTNRVYTPGHEEKDVNQHTRLPTEGVH